LKELQEGEPHYTGQQHLETVSLGKKRDLT
jgi:hypothetical protein